MEPPPAPAQRCFRFLADSPRRALQLRLWALFLVVVGARFYLVRHYALALPFRDQWDGIGAMVLRPWLHGQFDLHLLFAPHNEHRIVLTRLLALALTALNGQWDNLLEAAVNAVFCGVSAWWIARVLIAHLGVEFQRRILLAVAVYFVLPFGWENTLGGFQSQNYFVNVFSLAAIWGMGLHRTGSGRWWLGLTGAVLACLSMASGLLAAVAVVGVRALSNLGERRRPTLDDLGTGLLCFGIVAAGWYTRTVMPAHDVLKAESFSLFVVALGRFLAWPWFEFPVLGLVTLLPVGVLVVVYLRRGGAGRNDPGGRSLPGAELLLGVGFWVLLQCVALAYARGGHGAAPASRYMDALAFMALVNFLSWQLLANAARRAAWRRWVVAGALLWLGGLGWGLWAETRRDFTDGMPGYLAAMQRSERNALGYVTTHDYTLFLRDKPVEDLPHPNPAVVADLVDDPALRAVLPVDIRPSLPLQPVVGEGPAAFVPGGFDPACGALDGSKSWGSYAGPGGGGARGSFQARLVASAGLPYLKFSFAGYLGEPGLRFALGGGTDEVRRDWRPSRPAGMRWHDEYLRTPGRDLRLDAADESPARWFAFSEPVEVGFWSYWAGYLLRCGGKIFAAGVFLGLGVEAGLWPGTWAAIASRAVKFARQEGSPD